MVEAVLSPPFDLLGDVHGMIRTLEGLVKQLGYRRQGGRWSHPAGRTLISLGDLLDRGPDPLGCLEMVRDMVEDGCAHMILGNHEINAVHYTEELREHSEKNRRQFEPTVQQIEAEPKRWDRARGFLERCPTKLELDGGNLRVIHACWSERYVAELPEYIDTPELWKRTAKGGDLEAAVENCIKGPEEPCEPFKDNDGNLRQHRRVDWWEEYDGEPFITFGHYWFPWKNEDGTPREPHLLGPDGTAACLDYSAGKGGPMVALRYPEREFVSVPCLDDRR